MIQIHYAVFYIAAFLLLVMPLEWLIAAIWASAVHELFHILCVWVLNGCIHKVKVMPEGCSIETDALEEWKQMLSILAGPIGSLSLVLLRHEAPKIAVCGLIQGVHNLLPVLPLDGGRLLRLLLFRFCPKQADHVLNYVAVMTCSVINILAIWLCGKKVIGVWLLPYVLFWNIKLLKEKFLANNRKSGYNRYKIFDEVTL